MTKEYALVLSQTNKPSVKTESDHINLLAQICLENWLEVRKKISRSNILYIYS